MDGEWLAKQFEDNCMPVILAPEWEALWLDPSTTDPDRVLPLLQPFPAEPPTPLPAAAEGASESTSDEPAFDREMREARERLRGT